MRLRIRLTTYPAGLTIGDTPRQNCKDCEGDGGWGIDYAGPDGDYGGTHDVACTCWNPDRRWRLMRLPRWVLWRRPRGGFGYTPPF